MPFRKFVPIILLLATLTGCSTTIGTRLDADEARFEFGVTDKNKVTDTLGLPNRISKDSDKGLEYWFYKEKPELTSLILPTLYGTTTHTITAGTVDVPVSGNESIALICVFDKDGKLADIVRK